MSQDSNASAHTRAANQAAREPAAGDYDPALEAELDADAQRGFIGTIAALTISRTTGGPPVWDLKGWDFLDTEEPPDTVHPALWRQARRNRANGLFQVSERVYQVRGFDLGNMTLIEGDKGLIIIDPLSGVQVARIAIELYFRHRPKRPLSAVIYTHSRAGSYGGVRGVLQESDVRAGHVQVIAPVGFLHETLGEHLLAGNAMQRRAQFAAGAGLARGERGLVDAGLGKAHSSGTVSLIEPTQYITREVQGMRLDGVDCVFELTSGATAGAGMMVFHPQLKVLNLGALGAQAMGELAPLHGAPARDALAWSRHLGGAVLRYGEAAEALVGQHHAPLWGKQRVRAALERQRDLYRFIHDQTLRALNRGQRAADIAEQLRLPQALARDPACRSVFGHLKHNVVAVQQRYLAGWSGHPAELDPLPPGETTRRMLDYMGGADAALARARDDFARGEYRWVAQLCAQIVQVEPGRADARELCASALEQLGYQALSANWRNAWLQGARELREGPPPALPGAQVTLPLLAPDLIRALPLDQWFDMLAVRLDGLRAGARRIVLNWRFSNPDDEHMTCLAHGALSHLPDTQAAQADATLLLARATLDDIALGRTSFIQAIHDARIQVVGSMGPVMDFFGLLDDFERNYPVMAPRQG